MKFKGVVPVLLLSLFCWTAELSGKEASLKTASLEEVQQVEKAVDAGKQTPEKQQIPAPEKSEEAGQERKGWFDMMQWIPFVIIGVMIFLMFRASKKQQKQHQEMLDKIVKGSKVVLNSGVLGKVAEVREKEFLVEIADNVKVLVLRDTVTLIEEEKEVKK